MNWLCITIAVARIPGVEQQRFSRWRDEQGRGSTFDTNLVNFEIPRLGRGILGPGEACDSRQNKNKNSFKCALH